MKPVSHCGQELGVHNRTQTPADGGVGVGGGGAKVWGGAPRGEGTVCWSVSVGMIAGSKVDA